MKRLLTVVLLLLGVAAPTGAQTAFEEWRANQDALSSGWIADERQAYRDFVRADSTALDSFRQEVEQLWDEFATSTKKDWVEYADDMTSRTAVDFETGSVTVEVLVPEAEVQADPQEIGRKLRGAVAQLVTDRGTSRDYAIQGEGPKVLSSEPVLEGQLADGSGQAVTPETAQEFAGSVVTPESIETKAISSGDGARRVKARVTFALVPDHLRIRAQKHLPAVQAFSRLYGLDARLVLSVIHTESYFNPKAKSSVPAYGLMLLAPVPEGRAAYQSVHGKPHTPTPDYLYDAQNNIELGSAYLALVGSEESGRVTDPETRLYCVVAAYDTDANDVCRALACSQDFAAASRLLNSMAPEDVLEKLTTGLPRDEAREYLVRVLSRMALYDEWAH